MTKEQSEKEYIEELEQLMSEGREMEGLLPVKAKVRPDASSTFSVRLKRGEIGILGKAADARGLPLGTFIRLAALAAAAGELELANSERMVAAAEVREKLRELEALASRL